MGIKSHLEKKKRKEKLLGEIHLDLEKLTRRSRGVHWYMHFGKRSHIWECKPGVSWQVHNWAFIYRESNIGLQKGTPQWPQPPLSLQPQMPIDTRIDD